MVVTSGTETFIEKEMVNAANPTNGNCGDICVVH